jgi:transposase InsO family protein
MHENKKRHTVMKMAKILKVSRSGYYSWAGRGLSTHEKEDRELSELIAKIFEEHHGRYGSPRIWAELKERNLRVSRKRVERLMRELKLQARKLKKHIVTTDSNHHYEAAENILNREFHAAYPGAKWVSDITYLRSNEGWLYLATILDLYDRKVIGWSMLDTISGKLVCNALDMAILTRPPRKGLIFHSDRGIQYCSEEFRAALKKACPTVCQSMSRKGNCWDNACAESFFKTLKAELDILEGKHSIKQVRAEVFEYIETYYNRRRRHSAIGYAIPITLAPNMAA